MTLNRRLSLVFDRPLSESKPPAKNEAELEDWLVASGRDFYYDLEEIPNDLLHHWDLPDNEWYFLSKVLVHRDRGGMGHGTRAVREAISLVPPTAGILLKAAPFATRPGMNLNDLKNLYRRCGFRDYGPPSLNYMIWLGPQFSPGVRPRPDAPPG